jgi:hypothetical protein
VDDLFIGTASIRETLTADLVARLPDGRVIFPHLAGRLADRMSADLAK